MIGNGRFFKPELLRRIAPNNPALMSAFHPFRTLALCLLSTHCGY